MSKLLIVFIFAIIVIGGGIVWFNNGLAPVNKRDTSNKMFVVEKGAGLRAIANDLKEQGLIKDSVAFFLYVKQQGIDRKIQAGDFRLSPSMDSKEIAQSLTKGGIDVWIVIPEGKRADEIADILKQNIPAYEESWREQLNTNEGHLFTDTYLIPKDATIDLILKVLRGTFDQKYQTVPNTNGKSMERLVIIASLIEREARHDEDRPLVSSVIQNRLNEGMKLDIDATIQYAVGNTRNATNWWPEITRDDYTGVHSPYNTYLNPGLPPGPIANPGVESLEAAANPALTSYLYYISDKNGVNRYARTISEHNANIQKYGL